MDIRTESEIKIHSLQALMEELKLDGIFLKRQDDFAWITCGGRNYVGAGDMGNAGVLVKSDGKAFLVTNNIEAPRMVDEENVGDLGYQVQSFLWHDNSGEKDILLKLVPSGKIGMDFGSGSIADEVKKLRFSLTESEVDRYVKIGFDASSAMEKAAFDIIEGQSEYEIASSIMKHMERLGLELVSCMVAGDERISRYRHPLPTSNKIRNIVQIGGNFRRNGLIICMTRYVCFGSLPDKLVKQYRDNQLIDCTYISASRPGNDFTYPLLAGKKKYEELGYADEFDKHHQGGPIGYAGRDYRVDFNTKGKIAENQAFCWNPSITGTKSEDTVIVKGQGVIPVTRPVLFPTVHLEVDGIAYDRPDILYK